MSWREQEQCQLPVLILWCDKWLPSKTYPKVTSAWEVLSILVEGHSHDTVRGVESLLHTVSMMDVYVYVQNSLVVSKNEGTMKCFEIFMGFKCFHVFQNCANYVSKWCHLLSQHKHALELLNSGFCLLQQFQNSEYDVVDIAKPRGLWLLGMMQTSSPVDCNVCLLFVQLDSTSWSTVKKFVLRTFLNWT